MVGVEWMNKDIIVAGLVVVLVVGFIFGSMMYSEYLTHEQELHMTDFQYCINSCKSFNEIGEYLCKNKCMQEFGNGNLTNTTEVNL